MKVIMAAALAALFALLCFSSVEANPGVVVPWEIDCNNNHKRDGFIDDFGTCVPGVFSKKALTVKSPSTFWGLGDSYAPGVMERICNRVGCNGYKGGVALMSCGDIGRTAWIKLPGRNWDGPFKVVDCSQPHHLYTHVFEYGLIVEWGYDTAQRWGGVLVAEPVIVHLGERPNANTGRGWYYPIWFERYAVDWEQPLIIQNHVASRIKPLYSDIRRLPIFPI